MPSELQQGIDHNKVALLIMAVLEKRANLMLQNQDAYLKATGGVKLNEPAIDSGNCVGDRFELSGLGNRTG
jgi:DNA repair protein RadA/Sms